MELFCKHNYELVNQFVIPSEFDIIKENGYVPTSWDSITRTHVTDYKCSKCNKLIRKKEYTYQR